MTAALVVALSVAVRRLGRARRRHVEQFDAAWHAAHDGENLSTLGVYGGVQFARRDSNSSDDEAKGAHDALRFAAAIAGILTFSLITVTKVLNVPTLLWGWRYWLLIGVALLAYLTMRGFVALRRHRASLDLPPDPNDANRLRCIGAPDELTSVGPLQDAFFEPADFNISWTPYAFRRGRVRTFAGLVGATVGLACIIPFAGRVASVWHWLIWLQIGAATFSAYIATAILWHTRLRIVPGQIELLQFPVFSRGRAYREVIPLRESRVLVNLWKHYVRVERPDVEEGKWVIATTLVPRRRELAYYVLLAALSTHEPGPVDVES